MNLLMACLVSAMAGLGAEVLWTGLRSPRGWGMAKPVYGAFYFFAPPAVWLLAMVCPLPWRLLPDVALLLAVDSLVRWREGETRAEQVRALRFAPVWAALAAVLEWVAR